MRASVDALQPKTSSSPHRSTPVVGQVGFIACSLHRGSTHHGGTVGHLSNSYKGLIIGFGFVVGDFAENSKKDFALDWIVTGSRSN